MGKKQDQSASSANDDNSGVDELTQAKRIGESEKGAKDKGKKAKEERDHNAEIARALLGRQATEGSEDLFEMYRQLQGDEIKVPEVRMKTGRDGANLLFLSELLLGHHHSAPDFFRQVIETLPKLPEGMKPDAIVMSGLLMGDFKFRGTDLRQVLAPSLAGMDAQFREGKRLLDMARETEIQVIYNMGTEDDAIARDYTVEVFRKMERFAKKKGKNPDHDLAQSGVGVTEQLQMQRSPQWLTHLEFQKNVAFPYMLRSGRRLHSDSEMRELTGGEVDVEEYFLLFDAVERMAQHKKLTKAQRKWLEVENIGERGNSQLMITRNLNLTVDTDSSSYTDRIRHHMNFSGAPMYGDHLSAWKDFIRQTSADGVAQGNLNVTQHNHEAVGIQMGSQNGTPTWLVSNGGLFRPRLVIDTIGGKSNVAGDPSLRLLATRRRAPTPNATSVERTGDGRTIFTVFNEALMEKSHSIQERVSLVVFCDWQNGSTTSRPDYQIKLMDYVFTRVLGEGPVALMFAGDIIHGRMYPDMPNENQHVGLMQIDSQIEFVKKMIKSVLRDLTPTQIAGIERTSVQPGNHEWQNGTTKMPGHGGTFSDYIVDAFTELYVRAGYSQEDAEKKVRFNAMIATGKGEYFRSFADVQYFGESGVTLQHFTLDRGAKGSTGREPIYQSLQQTTGVGDLKRSIDFELNGHWHHPMWAMFGDKLAVVNGSIAGISGYEYKLGYRAVIGSAILHIGGGLPPQIEFLSESTLIGHKIKNGVWSQAALRDRGFTDDEDWDPVQHGLFMPDSYPKGALQKAVLASIRDASTLEHRHVRLRA